MGTIAAKQQWNKVNLKQLKISVSLSVAEAFRTACKRRGVTMSSVFKDAIDRFIKKTDEKKPTNPYKTRSQRVKAVRRIEGELEMIQYAQQNYADNFPENLAESIPHEEATQDADKIQEVIDLLAEVFA